MTPPGTFERVYAAVKQRLREGVYKPGSRLEPAVLSDELNASVTPVRDALHRLTGERLVDAPRNEGFRVPMLTEPLLRALYGWHRDLLLLALASHRSPIPDQPPERTGASLGNRLSGVFMEIVQSTGNPEHAAALEAVTHRLEPVQQLEEVFLDDLEREAGDIDRAIRDRDHKALRRSLARYHRRRARIAPELLAALLGR